MQISNPIAHLVYPPEWSVMMLVVERLLGFVDIADIAEQWPDSSLPNKLRFVD